MSRRLENIYIYIRHRALRVWCDRVFNFAFRLLLFDFSSKLILGAPPDPDGR